jgi:hypothetical protein
MTPEERAKRNRRFIEWIAPVALPDGNAGKHGPPEKPRASAK